MSLWLTHDELEDVTGYTQPSRQAEFLRTKYGIVVVPTRNGIRLLRSVLHEAQLGRKMDGPASVNLDALNG